MKNIFSNPNSASLENSSRIALEEVLKVQNGERVLIISNPVKSVSEVAMALYNAASTVGAEAVLVFQPVKTQFDFADDAVIEAISSRPDVFISISAGKLGKDRYMSANPKTVDGKNFDHIFRYLLGTGQLRAFWSPSIDQDMFARTVAIDYGRLSKEALFIKEVLDKATQVRIYSPGGTDLTIGIKHRTTFVDDGNISAPGKGGNLPAGEAFISPELFSSNGTIVFDGSISLHNGDMLTKKPVKIKVEEGFAKDIEGGREAEQMRQSLQLSEQNALEYEKEGIVPKGMGEEYRKNARNLGELGIGLNPNARVSGNMLEDEKAYGTTHIALGSNYDEDAPALSHLDCLIRNPDITALFEDGKETILMEKGELRR